MTSQIDRWLSDRRIQQPRERPVNSERSQSDLALKLTSGGRGKEALSVGLSSLDTRHDSATMQLMKLTSSGRMFFGASGRPRDFLSSRALFRSISFPTRFLLDGRSEKIRRKLRGTATEPTCTRPVRPLRHVAIRLPACCPISFPGSIRNCRLCADRPGRRRRGKIRRTLHKHSMTLKPW